MSGRFRDEELARYAEDGYAFLRGLFEREEIDALRTLAKRDQRLDQAATALDDGQGNQVRLSLWNHPGDGLYGHFARCRRVVDSVEQLLGGDVYHYHSKMVLKDALTGGAWAWHQDYGYWYQNGLLFPDLCSVMIAIDPATRENGCLQLLRSSHRMGRLNHVLSGEQAGADRERVAEAAKRLETVEAVMEPGDAVFFHANTLHASGANASPLPRWAMICCYNAASNEPYRESHHPGYTPLSKVEDGELLRLARERLGAESAAEVDEGVEFANLAEDDRSAKDLPPEAD